MNTLEKIGILLLKGFGLILGFIFILALLGLDPFEFIDRFN